ncbi:hypothetical protein Pyn_34414 [Prunus yedoensis var. nudiflora]|uniref:Uncharacterized protein n=1 Tax=Prunus yedoensis var. nudiflora TaxID=2094558 RepID=A0A314ZPQ4_PRUYE|nr:hypothetical protein Pyn_34414 [Prunus yedoensis var. nudiflora]
MVLIWGSLSAELGRFRFTPIDAVPSWEWLWLWARLVPWKSKRPLAAGHFGSAACGCRGSSEDAHRPEQRPLGTSKKALPTSCSTVLVPARVVQALKLNIDDMCAPQPPPPSASFQCKLQPWIWFLKCFSHCHIHFPNWVCYMGFYFSFVMGWWKAGLLISSVCYMLGTCKKVSFDILEVLFALLSV